MKVARMVWTNRNFGIKFKIVRYGGNNQIEQEESEDIQQQESKVEVTKWEGVIDNDSLLGTIRINILDESVKLKASKFEVVYDFGDDIKAGTEKVLVNEQSGVFFFTEKVTINIYDQNDKLICQEEVQINK